MIYQGSHWTQIFQKPFYTCSLNRERTWKSCQCEEIGPTQKASRVSLFTKEKRRDSNNGLRSDRPKLNSSYTEVTTPSHVTYEVRKASHLYSACFPVRIRWPAACSISSRNSRNFWWQGKQNLSYQLNENIFLKSEHDLLFKTRLTWQQDFIDLFR